MLKTQMAEPAYSYNVAVTSSEEIDFIR
jgi:hypothetical protein